MRVGMTANDFSALSDRRSAGNFPAKEKQTVVRIG